MFELCAPACAPAYSVLPGRRMVATAAVKRHAQGESEGSDGSSELANRSRREMIMTSISLAALGAEPASNFANGRNVVNSLLSAYGLPQLPASKGFVVFDDFDEVSTAEAFTHCQRVQRSPTPGPAAQRRQG